MYLHLGYDSIVNSKDIIAIFDMESTTVSKISREFLSVAQEEGFIETVSEDLPKSYAVCEIKGKSKVFISPISSATLLKRIKG